MLYVDTRNAAEPEAADTPERQSGEPPARFETRTTRQLFDDLAQELREADLVRVTHTEWLADDGFRREVEALASLVRTRGGRVEMR